ncbi:hypothetical protein GH714_000828 [Hevea brasiliensis]|uniref:Uncharacterized protein n=1 Tax=Hevea brasiliensis TaxID=3981 RepID=A0A6A6M8H9_HEVBR|nr:hypothetical protein GH714_000828 [Hevea brasiliensis]
MVRVPATIVRWKSSASSGGGSRGGGQEGPRNPAGRYSDFAKQLNAHGFKVMEWIGLEFPAEQVPEERKFQLQKYQCVYKIGIPGIYNYAENRHDIPQLIYPLLDWMSCTQQLHKGRLTNSLEIFFSKTQYLRLANITLSLRL